jgi:hypothetical protein
MNDFISRQIMRLLLEHWGLHELHCGQHKTQQDGSHLFWPAPDAHNLKFLSMPD